MKTAFDLMTKQGYLAFHRACCDKMVAVTAMKNSDYTTKEDPFSNFKNVETLGITSAEVGFIVRMTDKMSRIASLLRPDAVQQVKDESVDDTLLDLANYAILLMGYRAQKKQQKSEVKS